MHEEDDLSQSDHILIGAEFLKSWQEASEHDRETVLNDYCRRFPSRAHELRSIVQVRRLVHLGTIQPVEPEPPLGYLGDFRIVRELPHRGMGHVFEAIQQPLDRRVALKTIRGGLWQISEEAERKFRNEQHVLARLHHTHIVPILAAGLESGLHYFAMPYIDGEPLSKLLMTASSLVSSGKSTETPSLVELAMSCARECDANSSIAETNPWNGSSVPIRTERQSRGEQNSDGEPAITPVRKVALSRKYLRSVASVMADAADALQDAHEARIIHRDLKPSNIMLDRNGHSWVIDFGLASVRNRAIRELDSAGASLTENSGTLTQGGGGTPPYMAPEQFNDDGCVDPRTDVWGLGVTLYEMLAWKPAYSGLTLDEVRSRIRTEPPAPIESLADHVPGDLALICRKAMAKDPEDRYQTAEKLRDDLHHWLASEPTSVWCTPWRRMTLWIRRNRGWSVAIGVLFLVLVVVAGVALAREREQRRQVLVQQLQRILFSPHRSGWWKEIETKAWEASKLGIDDQLQSIYASSLGGIDASRRKQFDFSASALAFDRAGKRLVMPGTKKGLQLWDSTTGQTDVVDKDLDGPVGFRADGTALVLSPTVTRTERAFNHRYPLELWNVETRRVQQTFADPVPEGSAVRAWSISPDGSKVGAASELASGARWLFVWEVSSGKTLRKISYNAAGLSFSPDGSLLAAWDDSGEVRLCRLSDGEFIVSLSNESASIQCVAFGKNHWRRGQMNPATPGQWLLAAGDVGGTVTVWDLETRHPRTTIRGSPHDIKAMAFSLDGTILASTGRELVRMWDVATGDPLLHLNAGNYLTALALSPDGRFLTASSAEVFAPPSLTVWTLEESRGIQTLRGLPGPVVKAVFSPDGRRVAGLSHDWWVAIWDRESGRLVRVLDVPRGFTADNSGLAFSPDGRRFAFSAGQGARLWDIDTGAVIGNWLLPPGVGDTLAFHGADRLLLLRTETKDEFARPVTSDPVAHPRVQPLRDLLDRNPREPIALISDFNWEVYRMKAARDGSFFLIEGRSGPEGKTHTINAYDSSGKRLWIWPLREPFVDRPVVVSDPSGRVLALADDDSSKARLFTVPDRSPLFELDSSFDCLGPEAERWIHGTATEEGIRLYEKGRTHRLVEILTRGKIGLGGQFSTDGRYTAWGNSDGSVSVVYWNEIETRLAKMGLGW